MADASDWRDRFDQDADATREDLQALPPRGSIGGSESRSLERLEIADPYTDEPASESKAQKAHKLLSGAASVAGSVSIKPSLAWGVKIKPRSIAPEKDAPVMEIKGTRVGTSEFRPNRVLVFRDRIEEIDPGFLKTRTKAIRYEQLAQISVQSGVLWTHLTFESTGGHSIVANGLKKPKAEEIRALVERLSAEARQQSRTVIAAPLAEQAKPDMADQLRKIAALRDDGILTDEEFDAKKKQLLEAG
jgi:Short C-terminal domain/DNA helicase IV / RNA helicase N terminal